MNTVAAYLEEHWQRLRLDRFGSPAGLSCVLLTPGFQASSHLVAFVLSSARPQPVLVVKLPRLSGDHGRLDLEAANLQRIHRARSGGFDSIPQLVAYEDWQEHRLLVETMLEGRIMRPALVRRQTDRCIRAALTWLEEVYSATQTPSTTAADWFEKLVDQRLTVLEESFPLRPEEARMLEQTRKLLEPLRKAPLPFVFEHGDFSSPNLLLNGERLGVVDWELAEPRGLPGADLFFFLTYVAFAKRSANKSTQYLKAVEEAFLQPGSWAESPLRNYCQTTGLSPVWLKPLFVLSWARYVANMVSRLRGEEESLSPETVKWLRGNRYFLIWQQAVQNSERFVKPTT